MSEMVVVNLRLPQKFEEKIKRVSLQEYISLGEFVRSSIVRMLMKNGFLSSERIFAMLRKETQEKMKKRREMFDSEKELMELRKLRELGARKYEDSVGHK